MDAGRTSRLRSADSPKGDLRLKYVLSHIPLGMAPVDVMVNEHRRRLNQIIGADLTVEDPNRRQVKTGIYQWKNYSHSLELFTGGCTQVFPAVGSVD